MSDRKDSSQNLPKIRTFAKDAEQHTNESTTQARSNTTGDTSENDAHTPTNEQTVNLDEFSPDDTEHKNDETADLSAIPTKEETEDVAHSSHTPDTDHDDTVTHKDANEEVSTADLDSNPPFHKLEKKRKQAIAQIDSSAETVTDHPESILSSDTSQTVSLTEDNDTETDATIVTDTKTGRKSILSDIGESVTGWFTNLKNTYITPPKPSYTVSKTEHRAGVLKEATSQTGTELVDHDTFAARIRARYQETQDSAESTPTEPAWLPSLPAGPDSGIRDVTTVPRKSVHTDSHAKRSGPRWSSEETEHTTANEPTGTPTQTHQKQTAAPKAGDQDEDATSNRTPKPQWSNTATPTASDTSPSLTNQTHPNPATPDTAPPQNTTPQAKDEATPEPAASEPTPAPTQQPSETAAREAGTPRETDTDSTATAPPQPREAATPQESSAEPEPEPAPDITVSADGNIHTAAPATASTETTPAPNAEQKNTPPPQPQANTSDTSVTAARSTPDNTVQFPAATPPTSPHTSQETASTPNPATPDTAPPQNTTPQAKDEATPEPAASEPTPAPTQQPSETAAREAGTPRETDTDSTATAPPQPREAATPQESSAEPEPEPAPTIEDDLRANREKTNRLSLGIVSVVTGLAVLALAAFTVIPLLQTEETSQSNEPPVFGTTTKEIELNKWNETQARLLAVRDAMNEPQERIAQIRLKTADGTRLIEPASISTALGLSVPTGVTTNVEAWYFGNRQGIPFMYLHAPRTSETLGAFLAWENTLVGDIGSLFSITDYSGAFRDVVITGEYDARTRETTQGQPTLTYVFYEDYVLLTTTPDAAQQILSELE
jgi:hypothetical protein